MRRPAMLLVSLVLALSAVSWTAPAADVTAQGYSPDAEELAFVDLLNGYRGSLGLGPVSLNYQLGAAADYHSYDMGTYNYFAHSLSDGSDAGTNIRNFGYTGSSWAENIAAGMSTAQEAFTSWQNSPEHNATMTDPQFSEVGVGRAYVEGSQYGWYWTATYGGGAPVAAEPVADPGVVTDPTLLANNGGGETITTTLPEPIYVSDGAANIDTSAPETTIVYDDGGGGERKGGHKKRNRNGGNQQQAAVDLPQEAVELPQNAVNADGDNAAATGGNPVANGTGDTIIYGDVNTGGVQGETIVYEPPSLTVSGEPAAPAYIAPAETTAPETTMAPTETEKVYSEPNFTESVSTNIETNDGNGQALGG